MFYTYLHRRNDTRQVFYVGKGVGRRSNSHSDRNQHWKNVVKKHGYTIEINAYWDQESDALLHEVLLIEIFRSLGHPITNMTDGGEGMSGFIPTPETLAKRSASLTASWANKSVRDKRMEVMRSFETRNKMSDSRNKLFLNDEFRKSVAQKNAARVNSPESLTEKSKAQKRRWLDPIFRSQTTTAMKKFHNRPEIVLAHSAASAHRWQDPAYIKKMEAIHSSPEFRQRMSVIGKATQSARSKPVICTETNICYPSTLAAGLSLGIAQASISAACRGVIKKAGGLSFQFILLPTPESTPPSPPL